MILVERGQHRAQKWALNVGKLVDVDGSAHAE